MSAASKAVAALNQAINPARLSRMAQKASALAHRIQTHSIEIYHQGRLFAAGPLRNGLLIGRELVKAISREREFVLPQERLAKEALSTYRLWWNRASDRIRSGHWRQELVEVVKSKTWRQVGNGALVAAEIASLFYISKLVLLSGKKTIRGIF